MAKILFAWELGGGLGHVANLLPMAKELAARKHSIAIGLRDLSTFERVFRGLPMSVWQAPFKNSPQKQGVPEPRTFADILFNCGFGDVSELKTLVRAWRAIVDSIRPTVIVAEHSPSAILAAKCVGVPVVMVGTGFCCPPEFGPWPDLRPWSNRSRDHVAPITARVLTNCNEAMRECGVPPLSELPELFRVAATCLQTVRPLDPYVRLPETHYFGAWPHWAGKRSQWPEVPGRRIFAYLKAFPALPQFLAQLAEFRQPTIVVSDGIDRRLQKQFTRPWLHFENEPLDVRQAAEQCDIAICNANHGTTLALLQAGKPALYLPLHLEQTLTGYSMQKLRAGAMVSIRRPEQFAIRFLRLQDEPHCRDALRAIRSELAGRDSNLELARIVNCIEAVATGE